VAALSATSFNKQCNNVRDITVVLGMPENQDMEQDAQSIAAELQLPFQQVLAAMELLSAGNTIPLSKISDSGA
jgi:hypothetical protein